LISTLIFVWSCAVLAYTGFCRLVRTDVRTALHIRAVFWLMTVAAVNAGLSVILWGYQPGWPAAALTGCMAAVQVATSVLWRYGVPAEYQAHAAARQHADLLPLE
jgi:hypothetical protein